MPPESYGVDETPLNKTNIYASDFPVVHKGATIASGEGELVRGTVLGQVTATEEYRAYASGNADGSENPVAILGVDVDATDEAVDATIEESGHYDASKLTGFQDSIRSSLRALGIYVSGSAS